MVNLGSKKAALLDRPSLHLPLTHFVILFLPVMLLQKKTKPKQNKKKPQKYKI